jgi:RNA polymerase sigma factor (sigma-70 family)
MREYRVKVTVRNNLLLTAMENAGYKTQADFARAAGLSTNQVNELVAMRKPPLGEMGDFCETAKVIMEVLGACPSELWSDEQLVMSLKRNTSNALLHQRELLSIFGKNATELIGFEPENVEEQENIDLKNLMENTLSTLTPREKKVLQLKFGVDTQEHTYYEIGNQMDLTAERIRQIEAKALKKMRHPSRSDDLKQFLID